MAREPDVIDLGVLRPADADEPEEVRGPAHWARRLAAFAAVAALLGGVSAAVPPPPPRITELARVSPPGEAPRVVDAGLVMLFDQVRAAAYEPDTWRPLWSVPGGGFVHAAAHGDTVVLYRNGTRNAEGVAEQAVGVDRATGRRLWGTGRMTEVYAGVLLSSEAVDGRYGGDSEIHDIRTDTLLWRVPANQGWALDEHRAALWLITPDGTLAEHDARTGTLRRTARLPLPQPGDLQLIPGRDAVGIVAMQGDGGYSSTRRALWYRVEDFASVSGAGQWPYRMDCGAGLSCAFPAFEGTGFLVDTATGAYVRALPDAQLAGSPVGPLVLGDEGSESVFSLATVRGVLNPATGALEPELKGWRVVGHRGDLVRLLGVLDATRRVTYLAELTERGLVRLGPVPHLLRECQLVGRTAVCSAMSGEVVVLRIGEGR